MSGQGSHSLGRSARMVRLSCNIYRFRPAEGGAVEQWPRQEATSAVRPRGDTFMRRVETCCAAIFAAIGVNFSLSHQARGGRADQADGVRRPRPTRPFRRPAIRCTARRSTTDRDMPHTSCPAWARFISRSPPRSPRPSIHRPRRRAASLLLLLRIRAIVPPGRQDRPRLRHGLLGHGDVEYQ